MAELEVAASYVWVYRGVLMFGIACTALILHGCLWLTLLIGSCVCSWVVLGLLFPLRYVVPRVTVKTAQTVVRFSYDACVMLFYVNVNVNVNSLLAISI